jgi:hypothetical protein
MYKVWLRNASPFGPFERWKKNKMQTINFEAQISIIELNNINTAWGRRGGAPPYYKFSVNVKIRENKKKLKCFYWRRRKAYNPKPQSSLKLSEVKVIENVRSSRI